MRDSIQRVLYSKVTVRVQPARKQPAGLLVSRLHHLPGTLVLSGKTRSYRANTFAAAPRSSVCHSGCL